MPRCLMPRIEKRMLYSDSEFRPDFEAIMPISTENQSGKCKLIVPFSNFHWYSFCIQRHFYACNPASSNRLFCIQWTFAHLKTYGSNPKFSEKLNFTPLSTPMLMVNPTVLKLKGYIHTMVLLLCQGLVKKLYLVVRQIILK